MSMNITFGGGDGSNKSINFSGGGGSKSINFSGGGSSGGSSGGGSGLPSGKEPGLILGVNDSGEAAWVENSAEKLKTPRQISLTGEAHGQASFDGTSDVAILTTVSALSNTELEGILR